MELANGVVRTKNSRWNRLTTIKTGKNDRPSKTITTTTVVRDKPLIKSHYDGRGILAIAAIHSNNHGSKEMFAKEKHNSNRQRFRFPYTITTTTTTITREPIQRIDLPSQFFPRTNSKTFRDFLTEFFGSSFNGPCWDLIALDAHWSCSVIILQRSSGGGGGVCYYY